MGTSTQETLEYGYKRFLSKINMESFTRIITYGMIAFLFGRAALFNYIFPFGIALLVVLMNQNKNNVFYAPLIFLGTLSNSFSRYDILSYLFVLVLCGAFFYSLHDWTRSSKLISAACSSGISIAVGLIFQYFSEILLLFNVMMLLTEAFAILVFIYVFSLLIDLMENPYNNSYSSSEILICVLASVAVGFIGMSEVAYNDVRLSYVAALLITIIAAFKGGISEGGIAGITTGIIITAASYHSPGAVGLLGFSGMVTGFFKEKNKALCCSVFIICLSVFAFFVTGFNEIYISFMEGAVAVFLFVLIPKRILSKTEMLFKEMEKDTSINLNHSDQIREKIANNLKRYSDTFENLAVIYGRAFERRYPVEKEDISEITDKIKMSVCFSCQSKNRCWNKWGHRTERIIGDIINKADKGLEIDMESLEKRYDFICENKFLLLLYVQSAIRISGLNYKWQNKIESSREVMSFQFKGMAKSINKIIEEINLRNQFNVEFEEKIYHELHSLKLPVENIIVMEENEAYKVLAVTKGLQESSVSLIEKIVSDVMKKEYKSMDDDVLAESKDDTAVITLIPKPKYNMNIAVSRYAKTENICGDSHICTYLRDNEYMIALSDGMGSGEKAARESMITINTLYYLLKAGFDVELALNAMNSMLVLKSTEEIFSTVDMSLINLNTGKTKFFKIGAAAAFIKRSQEVEVIKYAALPIGMIDKIKIDEIETKIQENDIIIMISDGITDAVIEDIKLEWIKEIIANITSKDPQTISDLIISQAVSKYGEREKDDMTVITVVIS